MRALHGHRLRHKLGDARCILLLRGCPDAVSLAAG
jgi:hypothetical protein